MQLDGGMECRQEGQTTYIADYNPTARLEYSRGALQNLCQVARVREVLGYRIQDYRVERVFR